MPDIKLRDSSGVETTYENVNTIEVPLADGSGTYSYGLSDEELTFSGERQYALNDYGIFPNLDKYKDRICFTGIQSPISNVYGIALNSFLEGQEGDFSTIKIIMPPTLEQSNALRLLSIHFSNGMSPNSQGGITKIPRVYGDLSNAYVNFQMNNSWEFFDDLDYIVELLNSCKGFTNTFSPNSAGSINLLFFPKDSKYKDPTSICRATQKLALNLSDGSTTAQYSYYFEPNRRCAFLKEIPVIPAEISSYALTYLSGMDNYENVGLLSDFTFATDNGTPYNARWNNVNFNLSYIGWRLGAYSSTVKNWDKTKNIFVNDESTLEAAKARYELLKNEDYWFSQTIRSVSYEGVNTRLSMLFSRYNHDSAVRTINSLPNVADYGTCTLTLRYWSGAETDGGKVGDLTEEEIAVATEKGWTVAFNTSTT